MTALGEEHYLELHGTQDLLDLLLLLHDAVGEPVGVVGVFAEATFEDLPHLLVVLLLNGPEAVPAGVHGALNNLPHSWIHQLN